MVFGFQNDDGTVNTYWLAQMEYELMRQFKEELANLVFYGKSTLREDGSSTIQGSSGNAIEAGYGIREQFLPSNKHYYNQLTFDYLTSTLLDISYGKIPITERNFVIGTGEWGLRRLHNMCAAHLSANDYSWAKDTTGRAFSWSGNDIDVKMGQFRGAATIGGINVKFMLLPHYDDNVTNTLIHPDGGIAESHRMTIMDVGSKTSPNIQKIRLKGQAPVYNYIPGLRDPYNKGGLGRATQTASKVDGYELMLADWQGAVVRDPTRIVEFIPSILR